MFRPSRFQIAISFLLLITLLAAVAVVIWINLPAGIVKLEINGSNSMEVDGIPVGKDELYQKLNSKLRWHRICGKECNLEVSTNEATESLIDDVTQDADMPEFDNVTIQISYTVTVPIPEGY